MFKIFRYIRWIFVIVLFITTLSFTNNVMQEQDIELHKINFDYNQSAFRFLTEDIVVDYLKDLSIANEDNIFQNLNYTETALNSHSSVQNAEVHSDISGNVIINLLQRTPILRIKNSKFKDGFYLDKHGKIMKTSSDYSANVLIATGNINLEDTVNLHTVAKFIIQDDFWSKYINEIKVKDNQEIVLGTSFSSHIIEIGKPYDLENKFENLFIFYQDAFPFLDWDRYENINLKYKNQIVCTKK